VAKNALHMGKKQIICKEIKTMLTENDKNMIAIINIYTLRLKLRAFW